MRLRVAAIGQRMPAWVGTGWQEYAHRLPRTLNLELIELPMQRRGKNADIARLVRQEGESLLAAAPAGSHVVALEIDGKPWSTADLATRLERWMGRGQDLCFMVGGPDGLSDDCLKQAHSRWSLGPLTLPHPLVRVVLAEQLYRAWTITQNHPYHRA